MAAHGADLALPAPHGQALFPGIQGDSVCSVTVVLLLCWVLLVAQSSSPSPCRPLQGFLCIQGVMFSFSFLLPLLIIYPSAFPDIPQPRDFLPHQPRHKPVALSGWSCAGSGFSVS